VPLWRPWRGGGETGVASRDWVLGAVSDDLVTRQATGFGVSTRGSAIGETTRPALPMRASCWIREAGSIWLANIGELPDAPPRLIRDPKVLAWLAEVTKRP
jgi:hypothetical protein